MHSSYQVRETHHANLSLSIHERINDMNRRAYALAGAVAESAMDSGCTDMTARSHAKLGPRQVKAWDMIAEAYSWNAISDSIALVNQAEQHEAAGVAYYVGYGDDGYEITVPEPKTEEPAPQSIPFTDGVLRCTTCHRAAHMPGTWEGHYFTSNPQATADERANPGTGAEYYVIMTGYRAPANRPAERFSYQPGGAGKRFAEAVVCGSQRAFSATGSRTYDVYHADTEGQKLIVTVAGDGTLTWPRA